jgi:hypothetical protein
MMLTWVQVASAEDDDYSLYVNPGDTAVNIESGNLTAAVPYEWPRIIFYHEADPFSPHFDVGISRLYLFNDSDGDGNFCRSEATAVCFLDSNHVTWNVSTVEHGYDSELGEYASFSMSCNVSAYTPDENETMLLPDFASAAFRFSISEMSSRVVNSEGAYTVLGRNEIAQRWPRASTGRSTPRAWSSTNPAGRRDDEHVPDRSPTARTRSCTPRPPGGG